MTPEEPERLLTPEQAAERLQLAPITVADWMRAGKLPGFKLGGVWRIREADLNLYIREKARSAKRNED